MTGKQKQAFKVLAIVAVLSGACMAVYENTDQIQKLKQAVLNADSETETNTDSSNDASGSGNTDAFGREISKESEEEKTNVLAPSKSEEQADTESKQANTEQEQGDTEQEQETEQDRTPTDGRNNNPDGQKNKSQADDKSGSDVDLSSYSDPVRQKLKRAYDFYNRAMKHYEFVKNDELPLQRRKSENQKARELFKKTMTILDRTKGNVKNSDQNIQSLYKKASDMFGKCYRRAKMWGAF